MSQNYAGIDHIGIVASDLSVLESRYRSMGFLVAPRCELVAISNDGSLKPLNQHNSHLVFNRTYVELTAVTGDLKGHHLEQALSRYFGFHIVALLADNAALEHERLSAFGPWADGIGVAGRSIDYPSGSGMGRFKWFRIPDQHAPEAFFCYVEHLTPDLVFDRLLNDHPNGAHELHEVVLCTQAPRSSAERLAKICGTSAEETNRGILLKMHQGAIRIVGPNLGQVEYGEAPMPALPFALGFSVLTRDLNRTRAYLETAGFRTRDAQQALLVEPEQAGQPLVGFAQG